jgi:Fe-coproporphyrin III synthase
MLKTRYTNWLRYIFNNRNEIFGLRLTTTWRCNSRCLTCAIWQIKNTGKNDLTIEEVDRFSKSKYFKNTSYITLSGGEPTLRDDLPEIVSVLHANIPSAIFNMTTHGMNPDREEEIFHTIIKNNPKIKFGTVGLSINGPPEIHDETRGIKGSFQKVVETYNRIKDIVPCAISFTFCRNNVQYFEWVQEFAKSIGSHAYICWTVMNERFRTSKEDLVFWEKGMELTFNDYISRRFGVPQNMQEKLKGLCLLPPGIVYSYLYDNVLQKKIMPCYAGRQIVHIDPEGYVYPCNFKMSKDRIMGNIREKTFDEIWENPSQKILNEIKHGECMYPNGLCGDSDIFPSIINNPPAVIKWYLLKLIRRKKLIECPEEKPDNLYKYFRKP